MIVCVAMVLVLRLTLSQCVVYVCVARNPLRGQLFFGVGANRCDFSCLPCQMCSRFGMLMIVYVYTKMLGAWRWHSRIERHLYLTPCIFICNKTWPQLHIQYHYVELDIALTNLTSKLLLLCFLAIKHEETHTFHKDVPKVQEVTGGIFCPVLCKLKYVYTDILSLYVPMQCNWVTKKNFLLSVKHWLSNMDPCRLMVYCEPHIAV